MGRIVFRGIMIGICTLGTFAVLLRLGGTLEAARTGALCTLILSQLIHVFECKSERKTLFSIPYASNGWLIGAVLVSVGVLAAAIAVPALSLAVPLVSSLAGLGRRKG